MKVRILFCLFLLNSLLCTVSFTHAQQEKEFVITHKHDSNIERQIEEVVLMGIDSAVIGDDLVWVSNLFIPEDLDIAIRYRQYALRWLPDEYNQAIILNSLGKMFRQRGEYEQAIKHLKRSLAISGAANNNIHNLYFNMGDAYRKMGQPDSAIHYLEKCLEHPETRIVASYSLSELYHDIGDYKKAYTYKNNHTFYSDLLYQDKIDAELAIQKKEYEKEILRTELEWDYRQSVYIGCIAVLTLLLLLFAGYYHYRCLFARKEKQLAALEQVRCQNQIYISHKEDEIARLETLILSNESQNTQLVAEKESLQSELEEYKQNCQHPEELLFFCLLQSPFLLSKEQWDDLFTFTNRYQREFLTRLKEAYPQLTHIDLQYCCLIRLDFTYKQIATILNVNKRTIGTWKRRVGKSKFNIEADQIQNFLRLF